MKRKIIIAVIAVIVLAALGIGGFYMLGHSNNKDSDNQNATAPSSQPSQGNQNPTENKQKSAVVYFSATGTTRDVAEAIATASGSDIYEIVPAEPYTSADLAYNSDCRANREQNDTSVRPAIANEFDLSEYNTIYLGYPIWWGDVPKIILTFLDTHDLDNKTVTPFCTSHSSGISGSISTLMNYNKQINWQNGKRFGGTASQQEIESWISENN